MAQQTTEIELIPVTAQDIMGERKAMYGAFVASIPWAIGATVAVLVGIYLFWG
ncbi:preprotein translocase subunit SecE [Roseococcus sp. DSY-14]|uniref:preprotein translocase subunit SecE n=1 Tax=Roseococcus sp. DSY-14 TaxID=3369650 RepID=UPI00387AB4D7